ncbi:hypothetical protein LTR27_002136 [Elasticomyces elasticus]|nr:hypothetical protein LTR27_002136 [Elasticomyces elasticus]
MSRLFSKKEEVEVNIAITCNGWRQVGPAFQFCEKDDETALLYKFHNQWVTLEGWLPASLLRHLPPAYTLPKCFVIKLKKPFDDIDAQMGIARERAALQRMAAIQGRYIPRLLDQVQVEGAEKSALAMEYLSRNDLWSLSEDTSSPNLSPRYVDQICRGIVRCFDAITDHDIMHNDPELTNIMLVPHDPRPFRSAMAVLMVCAGTALLAVVDMRWGARLILTAPIITALVYLWRAYWTPPRVVLIDFEYYELATHSDLHATICRNVNRIEAERLCTTFRERCFGDRV